MFRPLDSLNYINASSLVSLKLEQTSTDLIMLFDYGTNAFAKNKSI